MAKDTRASVPVSKVTGLGTEKTSSKQPYILESTSSKDGAQGSDKEYTTLPALSPIVQQCFKERGIATVNESWIFRQFKNIRKKQEKSIKSKWKIHVTIEAKDLTRALVELSTCDEFCSNIDVFKYVHETILDEVQKDPTRKDNLCGKALTIFIYIREGESQEDCIKRYSRLVQTIETLLYQKEISPGPFAITDRPFEKAFYCTYRNEQVPRKFEVYNTKDFMDPFQGSVMSVRSDGQIPDVEVPIISAQEGALLCTEEEICLRDKGDGDQGEVVDTIHIEQEEEIAKPFELCLPPKKLRLVGDPTALSGVPEEGEEIKK